VTSLLKMNPAFNLVVIRCSDLAQSRRFYEALGLRFDVERHGSGPEHFSADVGGVVFELYPRGTGPASTGVRIGFRVPSLAAAVRAAQDCGAKVVSPPTEGPWGLRAVLADPDEHRVELVE
jgi:lactoylglutathione lyase